MDLIETKKNINRHPWELSRTDSLIKEIKKYHKGKNILDIGCGDSFLDNNLLKCIDIDTLYGIDIYGKNKKISNKHIVVNDYKKLKDKKFNSILLFDVIEHVPDDIKFMTDNVLPLLDDNGKIIMTVPAHQFLFSKHDEALKHYRRYNIKMIRELCNNLNLKIINYHYFYFCLLPIRLLSKLLNKDDKANTWKYSNQHIITKTIRGILNIDYNLSKLLNKLSCGLSLFVVIEKRNLNN